MHVGFQLQMGTSIFLPVSSALSFFRRSVLFPPLRRGSFYLALLSCTSSATTGSSTSRTPCASSATAGSSSLPKQPPCSIRDLPQRTAGITHILPLESPTSCRWNSRPEAVKYFRRAFIWMKLPGARAMIMDVSRHHRQLHQAKFISRGYFSNDMSHIPSHSSHQHKPAGFRAWL